MTPLCYRCSMAPCTCRDGLSCYLGKCEDVLPTLPAASVQCCVTSPPYWGLRDYGVDGQLGLEDTPEEYCEKMVAVFREVWRVLRDDGVLWVNMGDGYCGGGGFAPGAPSNDPIAQAARGTSQNKGSKSGGIRPQGEFKPKDLIGMPWMLAFALRADGWYLRSDVIWHKPNPMPESVTDRPTKAHEYIFLLTKKPRYFYDADAVREQGAEPERNRSDRVGGVNGELVRHSPGGIMGASASRNKRTVWTVDDEAAFIEWLAENYPEVIDDFKEQCQGKKDVWTVPSRSFPGAHFATFPPDLIVPCIMAGTSDRGACPECGAPWERVVEKELVPTAKAAKTFIVDARDHAADKNDQGANRQKDGHKPGHINKTRTVGWTRTCKCGVEHGEPPYDPVPCVVLDPFHGAGTTGMVCRQLGRHYIGIELNQEYLDMSLPRLRAGYETTKPVTQPTGQLGLFDNQEARTE